VEEAEQRRREQLTEAHKRAVQRTSDVEAATRRALPGGATGDKDAVGDA
jgi:hypothetical protein